MLNTLTHLITSDPHNPKIEKNLPDRRNMVKDTI